MSVAEEDPIRQLFAGLDKDGDGVLNKDDLLQVLPDLPEEKIDEVIKLLDTSGTGNISMADFLKNFEAFLHHTEQTGEDSTGHVDDGTPIVETVSEEMLGLPESRGRNSTIRSTLSADDRMRVHELFESLDVDSDGYLHLADFKTILPDVSLPKLQEIFRTINSDHSGSMSYQQFEDGWDELCRFSRYNSRSNSIAAMSSGMGGGYSRSGSVVGVDVSRGVKSMDVGLPSIGENEEEAEAMERQVSGSTVLSDGGSVVLHSGIHGGSIDNTSIASSPAFAALAAPPPPALSMKERVSQVMTSSTFSQFQNHLDTDLELTFDDDAEDEFYLQELSQRKAARKERLAAAIDKLTHTQTEEEQTDKDDEIAVLKERVERMKARAAHLQKKYTLLSQLGRQLQDDNVVLTTKLADAELNLKMAKNEVLDMRSQLDLYKEKAESLHNREKHLSKAVKSQEQTYEETQAQLSHELKHRERVNAHMSELKEQLEQLQQLHHHENRENLRSRLGKMKEIVNDRKNTSVSELQKSIERLTNEANALTAQLADTNRLVEERDNEIADLRRQLEQRAQFRHGRSLADEMADEEESRKRRGHNLAYGGGTIRTQEEQKQATIKRAAAMINTLKKTGTLKTPAIVTRPARGNTVTGPSPFASQTSVGDMRSHVRNPMSTLAAVGEMKGGPVRKKSMIGDKLLRKSRKERAKREEENKAALALAATGKVASSVGSGTDSVGTVSASMATQSAVSLEHVGTQTDDIPAPAPAPAAPASPAPDAALLAQLGELKSLRDLLESKYNKERDTREELEHHCQDIESQIAQLQQLLARYQQKELEEQAIRAREEQEMKRKEEEARRMAAMVKLSALDQAELTAYANYFNFCLHNDEDVRYLMPINSGTSEFITKIKDGWLIGKFLNYAVPGTVDERALNRNATGKEDGLNKGEVLENMTLALESCKAIGVQVSDINATTVILGHHNPQSVLALIWRLIMTQMLLRVNLRDHPELARICESGEEVSNLLQIPPQQLLIRWVNYHTREALKEPAVAELIQKYAPAAKGNLGIRSFLDEPLVQASFVHAVLMHALFPAVCDVSTLGSILSESSPSARASYLIAMSKKLGVPAAKEFITPQLLVAGGPLAARLTMAFTCSLFSVSTGLEATGEEVNKAALMEDDVGDSREERAFRMWINSMNLPNENNAHLYIHNLFTECKDGLVLLRVMDKIKPGCVNWKKVEKNPNNRFKKLTNCNEVIRVAKDELFLSVVGIAGSDMVDGNRKLTLSIVWQLMHFHITEFLNEVYVQKLGATRPEHHRRGSSIGPGRKSSVVGSVPPPQPAAVGSSPDSPRGLTQDNSDALIVKWANKKVTNLSPELTAKAASLVGTAYGFPWEPMKSFNDPKLADCLFFFHLLWSVEPRVVNWKLITDGKTLQDRVNNARYAISVARKLGATIFLLPEDLVEVKPKMITSFVASILALEGLKLSN